MNGLFIEVLNNGLIASILIFAVIIARFAMKKAPKWMTCALWGFVAIKLIFPFHIESVLSLIPSATPIPSDIEYQTIPKIESGIPAINEVINPILKSNFTAEPVNSVNPMQILISIFTVIWIMGIIFLGMYSLFSYFLLRKKIATSKKISDRIYLSDEIAGPFILGVIRPCIYLPSGLKENSISCVLEHEKAHLQRWDHIWKPLAYVILCIYWFQPLCWISYLLFCKDIELACDEKVTKHKDKEWKAAYCQALLDCNTKKRIIAVCPIAFGELSVKDRVTSILHYKKPSFWAIVIAIFLAIIIAFCFMTNPISKNSDIPIQRSEETTNENDIGHTKNQETLTMQSFVRMVTSMEWYENAKYHNIDFWENFNNLVTDEVFNQESLTNILMANLTYGNTPYQLQIYYWPEETAKEQNHETNAIDSILLCHMLTGDAICLYDMERDTSKNDIEEFLTRNYELPLELTANIDKMQSSKLSSKVTLGHYQKELFLNFEGCLLQSDDYVEPTHGDYTANSWYSLGGVGVCYPPDYADFATFSNGKLTDYQYMDNHMSCKKINNFTTGEYSACLYQYQMDLVTAPDYELLQDGESGVSQYWVIFFTKGEDEALYVKFFNCDYYSQEDAVKSFTN